MATDPKRLLLEHVPRVHFYNGGKRCPEDICFPSVMRALMEFLGDGSFGCRACRPLPPSCRIPCSYAFFVGVTGAASFLNWKPGWEGDNVEIMYMSDDPAAPFDRAFRAAGLECRMHPPEEAIEEKRKAIVESIRRGLPVIAFGPIGPPEAALVTGYDEDGGVLIGWSFFQDIPEFAAGVSREPSGEFRVRDWPSYPPGFTFLVVGEKSPKPAMKETARGAVEWMVRVARTPSTFGGRRNGIAAWDAWAEQVLRDGDFPEDERTLRQRHDVHNNLVGFAAEARWYGSVFLTGLMTGGDDLVHRGAIEDLYHAAALYAGAHDLMWKVWDLAGGNGNPDAWRRFSDPAVRRGIAEVLRQARDKDAAAAGHLDGALAAWKA